MAPLYNNDIRTLGIACPRDALMKTRRRNWPAETDAEIRAFVLGFATRRQGRAPQMPRVRGHFVQKLKVMQKQRLSWLGREDSNLRMAESKSAALPLGYAPSAPGDRAGR